MKTYLNYINGEWVKASTGATFEVFNPATGEVVGVVQNGGKSDAEQAVAAAKAAFPGWAGLSAYERSDYLMRVYNKMIARKEELGRLLNAEQGKPLPEAIGEIVYGASFILWYAEEAKRVYGEMIPASTADKRIQVIKQPVGVVGAITPWNFPNAMITRKIAPALAAGCTVVVKPAEQTPLSCAAIFEIFDEVGLPKGVANMVTGDAVEVGTVLTTHPDVRKVTFTGSTEVGKLIYRNAADTVKRVSLELGGHAPFIVFEDADLDAAAQGLVASKFRNNGQTCVCTNRVYVHESVVSAFTEKYVALVKQLKVGVGTEEGVNIGPLIDGQAMEKVMRHVEDAVSKGARLACGGRRLTENGLDKGYFFAPTVLTGVTDDMLIAKEETFGPVSPIMTFSTEEEVIAKANDTNYGLAAYFYTRDIGRATRVAEKLEYGIIGLNDPLPSVAQAPFGGFKESGIEREGGHHGIEPFLETKFISIKLS